eukprot:TRINITY_DN2413_c0_g2_i1.p1 TRINITY_DN2413_c0_g2~~TRINITY_DN2413_c0_g2_i1.p1  ORF type:complete len:1301 (+),score=300.71 TRINITY_DN2413_c0_g2_i1:1962-5864(+)
MRKNYSIPQFDLMVEAQQGCTESSSTIDWNAVMDEDSFVDDSCVDGEISNPVIESKLYHPSLKEKYHIVEKNGDKPLEIFSKEAIYSARDQDNILRMWINYKDNHGGGEELFGFLDEDDLGSDIFEKFVDFHVSAASHNQFGEMRFEEFVKMYQLLHTQYKSKDAMLGRIYVKSPTERESNDSSEWDSIRKKLLREVEFTKVEEGQKLFHQDESLTHVFFVFHGNLKILRETKDGQKQIIGTVGNGGYYGALELITDQKLIASGLATMKTHAIKLSVDSFKLLITRQQDLIWSMVSSTLLSVRSIQTVLDSEAFNSLFRSKDTPDLVSPRRFYSVSNKRSTNMSSSGANGNAIQSSILSHSMPQIHQNTMYKKQLHSGFNENPLIALTSTPSSLDATPGSSPPSPLVERNLSHSPSNSSVPTTSTTPSSSSSPGNGDTEKNHSDLEKSRTKREQKEQLLYSVLSTALGEENEQFIQKVLALKNNDKSGGCTTIKLKKGEYLYRRGDESDCIFILISGKVSRIFSIHFDKEIHIFPGSIIGEYSLLSGQNRTSDIRSFSRCEVLRISKDALVFLMRDNPLLLLNFIRNTITDTTHRLKALQYGYEYFLLPNGQNLIEPGQIPQEFYFLISGRLREQVSNEYTSTSSRYHTINTPKMMREYSRTGETIGISNLLMNNTFTTFTTAVRDTELVRFDKAWLTLLMRTNPNGLQSLIRSSIKNNNDNELELLENMRERKHMVAIVPVNGSIPVTGFTSNLIKVLKKHGTISVITEDIIEKRFGKLRGKLTNLSNERQNIWHFLSNEESKHDFVICLAKPNLSPWTRWILQQVDMVLIVTHADVECSSLTEWESTLSFYNSIYYIAEKRVVVLHSKDKPIKNTCSILQNREGGRCGVKFHHHIVQGNTFHYQSMARFLAGTAVGVVLGGGGSRGLAHIGVIRALREEGIPIDIVGGTSMGSQIAGLVAREMSIEEMSNTMWQCYTHTWRFSNLGRFFDITVPYLSLVSGRQFSNSLKEFLSFDGTNIEDLTIPFYCISCNITKLCTHVHLRGLMWEAMRASSSLPLAYPPFITPEGDALVDGAYIDNVPADTMRNMFGANFVIAVDVIERSSPLPQMQYKKHYISGWKIFFDIIFRGKKYATMHQLLLQLAGIMDWANCQTRDKFVDWEIRPDMSGLSGWADMKLQFEYIQRGYNEAKASLKELKAQKPHIWENVAGKVQYPIPMVSRPIKPIIPRFSILDSILFLLQPKAILALLAMWGISKLTFYFMNLFQQLSQYFSPMKLMNAIKRKLTNKFSQMMTTSYNL